MKEDRRYMLSFTLEELKDLSVNMDQCLSEGYISYGDPAYSAYVRILGYLELLDIQGHCEEE